MRHQLLYAILAAGAAAFGRPAAAPAARVVRGGMFDIFKGAFENEVYDDRRARASHILVATEAEAAEVRAKLDGGTAFRDAASEYSTCPSAKSGGSLGTFEPGKMVPEFDAVVFDDAVAVGAVAGPVKTDFGWHLILVEERFTNTLRSEGSSVF